ncbi:MAG: hypothetical protein LBK95_01460 [Bifidobacteriaceae bacterium]|nr:hypothetical protein [Bifidobacteriaceae bacterium]
MNTGARITRLAAPPAHDDCGAPLIRSVATAGGRLAAVSRAAQGLPATVSDPAVLARLRDLCGLPRPPLVGRCR